MMKTARIAFFCFLLTLFTSCTQNDNNGNDSDCTDIACTEIFVTINVTVKDASGVVIPLDDFKVLNVSTNEDLTRELSASSFEMASQNGIYPLFGDEYAARFQNESLDIIFIGFIEGEEIVNAKFKVGADCCHVQLMEGDTDIVIGQ